MSVKKLKKAREKAAQQKVSEAKMKLREVENDIILQEILNPKILDNTDINIDDLIIDIDNQIKRLKSKVIIDLGRDISKLNDQIIKLEKLKNNANLKEILNPRILDNTDINIDDLINDIDDQIRRLTADKKIIDSEEDISELNEQIEKLNLLKNQAEATKGAEAAKVKAAKQQKQQMH